MNETKKVLTRARREKPMSETEKIMPVDQRRIVRQFGEVWVAAQDGMAAIGATRKDALAGLADCIKCKTSLQIIHTWATFQGGRELVPKHVETLTTKTLAPFRLPNDKDLARRALDDTEPNDEGMARELNHSKTKLSPELQALLDSTRPLADLDLKGLKRSIRKAAQDSESPTNQNKQ